MATSGKVVTLALRQLLRFVREYPREPLLGAVEEAARYGLYDLDRLERMILRRQHERIFDHFYRKAALVQLRRQQPVGPAGAPPLSMIRSLAYFLPVIEEVLESRVSPDYFEYLRHKLARAAPSR